MPKINQGYQSLFEYLVHKDFPLARRLDEYFYPDENGRLKYSSSAPYGRRWNSAPYAGQQILGGLQPLADMYKDLIDTFKPYKTSYHFKRDLLQPISGIGNLFKGVATVVGAFCLFLGNTIRYAFVSGSLANFLDNMGVNCKRTGAWLLDGITNIIRGITQIAATPLTWILKIPCRGLITAIKGQPLIEQNQGIQRLVTKGKTEAENGAPLDLDCIRYELNRKFQKSSNRGQSTNIPFAKENTLFKAQYFKYGRNYEYPLREDRKQAALQYIGLFSKDANEQSRSITSDPVESCSYTSMEAYSTMHPRFK